MRAVADKESLAEDESYENYHPGFTYPVRLLTLFLSHDLIPAQIYGEQEKIYGYTDLVIDVSHYIALRPNHS